MSNAYAGRGAGSLKSSLGPTAPNFPSPGIGSMGAYMIAATPFMARFTMTTAANDGLVYKVVFPGVTRKIVINVTSDDTLRFAFDDLTAASFKANAADGKGANGSAKPYLTLASGKSFEMNVRATELYLWVAKNKTHTVDLFAEITAVKSGDMQAWSAASGIEGIHAVTLNTSIS